MTDQVTNGPTVDLTVFSTASRKLRVAIIGQSQFGADVYRLLRDQNHSIVGVFTIPDVRGLADPLAQVAAADGVPVHKFARWRNKGVTLPEVAELYRSVSCDLNVLPFCTQFIPMDVINYPKHQSICYHPSLLPKHRGASSINWTLINGDKTAGFSIFWADDGLDTGPILLQRSCVVEPDDTVDTLYNRFLYPEGIRAMGEAVQMVVDGQAPCVKQSEESASYEPIIRKQDAEIKWSSLQSATELHNFIRGNDRIPGAWAIIGGMKLSVFGSRIWSGDIPIVGEKESNGPGDGRSGAREVEVKGGSRSAIVHYDGMILFMGDGAVNVKYVQPENGRMIAAKDFGRESNGVLGDVTSLALTEAEQLISVKIREIWSRILNISDPLSIAGDADFFKMGAGSMHVVRLVEEIRVRCGGIRIETTDVYLSSTLQELTQLVILAGRDTSPTSDPNITSKKTGGKKSVVYRAVEMETRNGTVRFPAQLFIDNKFMDALDGGTFDTVNPTDETVICAVAKGTREDVDRAVAAAGRAFVGEWGRMNARDRGTLMFRLADLMYEYREELATIEAIDSGAVYTLALKTHIGMSIDAFRYFAGWTDKIHGKTIPINHARPARDLTYTRREPIGVCGIVTPWNYPLMMLAWKMSACLAAGNTIVLKPAQVTPLTSLKFAELAVLAGFPPGVINIVTGSGAVVGQALADHPDVRKLGFTGSTPVGKTIMASCAKSNLKRVSLELGGKSPLIVFGDADLDRAVRFACSSVFFNKGENCIAAGRIFVEDCIYDLFLTRVVEEVKRMVIGDPLETSTDHGPQNHAAHLRSLLEFIRRGVADGARLVYGGMRVERPGLFLYPTILADVADDSFIASEESFGPIMVVSRFKDGDIDSVIRRANSTEYALASGVFTRDINRALNVADRLAAGTVFVNTYNKTDVAAPFGGFKQSGFGKDLGEEALNEYLQTKAVTIEY